MLEIILLPYISCRFVVVVLSVLFGLPVRADTFDATQVVSNVKKILRADLRKDGNDETIQAIARRGCLFLNRIFSWWSPKELSCL